jgi:hypothetical protein
MTLELDRVKFRRPDEDLAFLKPLEKNLSRLSMNYSFPRENFENLNQIIFLKMESLEELSL